MVFGLECGTTTRKHILKTNATFFWTYICLKACKIMQKSQFFGGKNVNFQEQTELLLVRKKRYQNEVKEWMNGMISWLEYWEKYAMNNYKIKKIIFRLASCIIHSSLDFMMDYMNVSFLRNIEHETIYMNIHPETEPP